MAIEMLMTNAVGEKGELGTAQKIGGGGGGGSVTPESVATATGQMTPAQAVRTRENLNAAPAETVQTVTGTDPTISPNDRTLYICGELTSLTLSGLPASGLFEIVFKSGSTATEVTLPTNVLLPDGVSVEADTIYDISVRACAVAGTTYGLAAMQGWQVPGA